MILDYYHYYYFNSLFDHLKYQKIMRDYGDVIFQAKKDQIKSTASQL